MPRPTPIGLKHKVLALAREGMCQGAIADRVGIMRATVNRILQTHATTGKSPCVPHKITPRQDRALL